LFRGSAMTVRRTRISCFDSTWNPTFGCDPVSPGCDHCYAEAIATRFHGGFHVRLKPHRLTEAATFKPVETPHGPRPRRVFVDSMSDLWHPGVPDAYLDRVFDAAEANPAALFICLTKRAPRLAAYVRARWAARGVPPTIWLGVSVESPAQGGRLDQLRRLKAEVGAFTAVACLEPLLGPPDLDLSGMDWVVCGGESGAQARPVAAAWVRMARDRAHGAGAAFWFKAWGRWQHNPLWPKAQGRTQREKRNDLVARGLELCPEEIGGATLDGRLWQEVPPGAGAPIPGVR